MDSIRLGSRSIRRTVLVALGVVVASLLAGPAQAGAAKLSICHFDKDSGTYSLIGVSEMAVQQHKDRHGDGELGDPVSRMPGYVFGEDCIPEPQWQPLAQAYSIDALGNEYLIAELLDSNHDGVPSPGDTVRTAHYPKNVDGTDNGAFEVTTHVVDSVHQSDIPRIVVVGADGGQSRFEWEVSFAQERWSETAVATNASTTFVDWTRTRGGRLDSVSVDPESPSRPLDEIAEAQARQGDSPFLDIDFPSATP